MMYRALADLTVFIHLLFILLVLCGGLLRLWRRSLLWLHLPALFWGVGIELYGGVCPLTPLELYWRRLAAQHAYAGGFIEHYLIPVLYPAELTRSLQIGLGLFALGLNLAIYLWLWQRDKRAGRDSNSFRF